MAQLPLEHILLYFRLSFWSCLRDTLIVQYKSTQHNTLGIYDSIRRSKSWEGLPFVCNIRIYLLQIFFLRPALSLPPTHEQAGSAPTPLAVLAKSTSAARRLTKPGSV